ncbi:Protodermal factor 1 [Ananas comosus]|uniref:Protodermal factor 1 n=1 Tax=Ananas comosus TaxID=4615 RepID=A0A199W5B4_ANACO|nr:Protodermal factor 1 [Ananas comosus]
MGSCCNLLIMSRCVLRCAVIMEKERRGRGSNKNPDCSTPTHTTPTPSYGTPTPSHGSHGGGYSSPVSHPTPSNAPVVAPYTPTTPVTAPSTPATVPSTPDTAPSTPTISTPSPLIPVDPHFHYFTGSCDYWRSHPEAIWAIFGYWGTVGQYFGAASGAAFGKSMSLPDALANTRHDGIGALFREGTASFLNSIVNRNFPFTTQQVKDAFAAAVSSDGAATAQAGLFKRANEGRLKF